VRGKAIANAKINRNSRESAKPYDSESQNHKLKNSSSCYRNPNRRTQRLKKAKNTRSKEQQRESENKELL
jgi:hypothetical protein